MTPYSIQWLPIASNDPLKHPTTPSTRTTSIQRHADSASRFNIALTGLLSTSQAAHCAGEPHPPGRSLLHARACVRTGMCTSAHAHARTHSDTHVWLRPSTRARHTWRPRSPLPFWACLCRCKLGQAPWPRPRPLQRCRAVRALRQGWPHLQRRGWRHWPAYLQHYHLQACSTKQGKAVRAGELDWAALTPCCTFLLPPPPCDAALAGGWWAAIIDGLSCGCRRAA